MEKEYCERVVEKTIKKGPYVELENDTLQSVVESVNSVLEMLCDHVKKRLETMED